MTLHLTESTWTQVHQELAVAVDALARGDEATLAQAMTLLNAYAVQRVRRAAYSRMGDSTLCPVPESTREVANHLLHSLTADTQPPGAQNPPDDDDDASYSH
ncbi:hypothetical protein Val02_91550 [Virgisporangium aliadipatigenens]|uniref:CATRA-Associated Small Protein domain-containing protein n=1 Tax=Virgisporangium aliadipatigenens TaxID=741659 RepID=A0A8J4DVX4_9ACTN|nr:CATRA system-associated protein [Virgisporangium aliadipatigenens]GIJ52269.1 hypothetical protein Val02_91550 [Virgisporangium aliadipatigenens]